MSGKDEQAIRDLHERWRRATSAGDIGAILEMIDEEAWFMVPGQPPMRGRQQFKELFDQASGQFHIEYRSEFDEIAVHGNVAHAVCRMAVEMRPKQGGAASLRSGHVLTIFRKRGDGQWRVWRDANLLVPETGS